MSTSTAQRESFIAGLGCRAVGIFTHVGMMWLLLVDSVRWILLALFTRKVRLGRSAIIAQLVRIGLQSTPIVMLVSGAIGVILAFQMAPPLEELGQVERVPNIIAIAVLRELGPLMAGIVLVGFAGAAIAAEIGTMVVGEEIEALEAHALNPVRFLVVPRIIASVISLVCLSVFSNIIAIASAAFIFRTVLGGSWRTFYLNTLAQVDHADYLTGLVKAAIFGLLIGLIACGNGLKVTGGAAGVGRATTQTVVQSVIAIILASLIFTVIFWSLGWF